MRVVEEGRSALAVIPYSGEWKDIGTWNTLTEEMQEESIGDVVLGRCINTHVINELSIPVVALGTQNLVIACRGRMVYWYQISTKVRISSRMWKIFIDNRPMYERAPLGRVQGV